MDPVVHIALVKRIGQAQRNRLTMGLSRKHLLKFQGQLETVFDAKKKQDQEETLPVQQILHLEQAQGKPEKF